MATEDETIRLSLDTSGYRKGAEQAAAETDRLQRKARELEAELRDLDDAFRNRGTIGAQQYREEQARLTRELGNVGRRIRATETTVQKAEAAMGRSAGSTRNWTQVVMAASFGVADLNYGVGGLLNNIPQLIIGLGLGGGLSTILQVATAAASTLYLQAENLSRLWSDGETDNEAQRMDRLASATRRTFEQAKELEDLEDRKARREASASTAKTLRSTEGPAQQEAAKGVAEAITFQGDDESTGAQKLIRGLMADPKYLLENFATDEEKARLLRLNRLARANQYNGPVGANLRKQYEAERQAVLGRIVEGDASTGRPGLEALFSDPAAFGKQADVEKLRGAVEANRDALQGQGFDVNGFLAGLKGSDQIRAEAFQQLGRRVGQGIADVFSRVAEGVQKEADRVVKEQHRHDQEARAAETDDLNATGAENERIGKEQAATEKQEIAREKAERQRVQRARANQVDLWIKQAGGLSGVEKTLFDLQKRGLTGTQALEVGAAEARQFGMRHGLSPADASVFAGRAVLQAQANLENQGLVNTNQETRANTTATERLTAALERMERRGVPMVLRRGR